MSRGAFAAGWRLSPADRRQAIEAGWQLTRASVELRLIGSTHTVGRLGALQTGDHTTEQVGVAGQHEAQRVGLAVAAVARRLPWQPTCLRQALAVQRMLRRRHIASRLHLGVARHECAIGRDAGGRISTAHAWVTVDGRPVAGRRGIERFVPIAAFT